jgi:hypothetical protein
MQGLFDKAVDETVTVESDKTGARRIVNLGQNNRYIGHRRFMSAQDRAKLEIRQDITVQNKEDLFIAKKPR